MFRPSLEALETRETPAAHADLYLNVWINSGEMPSAAVRPRMFAIVDRTTLMDDAGSHALYQDVRIPAAAGDSF